MPNIVLFPFQQDERLGSTIEVPAGIPTTLVDPALPESDQWSRLVVLYRALADEVASQLATATSTTVACGDCLALLGTLTGVQRAGFDPSLIWFDAHGDVHTLETSTSGYLGGMPLRMALGGDADKLVEPLGLDPLSEDRVVLVDARDLDPAEVDFLASSQILRRTVSEIRADDLPDGLVVLHLDLDVIDCVEVTGLRFPVPDGPSRIEVVAAVHRLIASGRIVALSLAGTWFEPADDEQARERRELLDELLAVPA